MSKRHETNPSKDKKIFANTARKTKKINIAPDVMRGGIRL